MASTEDFAGREGSPARVSVKLLHHTVGSQAWRIWSPLRAASVAAFFYLGPSHKLFLVAGTFSLASSPFARLNPMQEQISQFQFSHFIGSQFTVCLFPNTEHTWNYVLKSTSPRDYKLHQVRNYVCLVICIGTQ